MANLLTRSEIVEQFGNTSMTLVALRSGVVSYFGRTYSNDQVIINIDINVIQYLFDSECLLLSDLFELDRNFHISALIINSDFVVLFNQ